MVDLSIVIPCYNEAANVLKLQQEFFPVAAELSKSRSVEVIFVDDGSTDGTGDALAGTFGDGSRFGVQVKIERHNPNRGLGAAIRTGLAASSGEIIVTTDSDGTYKFSEIPALLSYLTADIDIVTASPYHPDGSVDGVPAYRLMLSRGSSTIYRLVASRHVHCYTALFRAYRRAVVDNVPFKSSGFLAGTELMVNAMRMGYTVAEYPTVLHQRAFGESKAKLMHTIQAHLNYQMQILMPWQPYGTVIQGTNESVYLYDSGQKRLFPTADMFLSHGYLWEQIVQVNDSYLDSLPEGPSMNFREGTLVKGSGETIYVMEHGEKRAISFSQLFIALGYRKESILKISDSDLNALKTGPAIFSADKHPDGTLVKGVADNVYLLEDGKRCWFPSPQVFLSWGYKWEQVITISEGELASYPMAEPIEPQTSFYLKNIQEAIRINIRPEEIPSDNFLTKLPHLVEGVANKMHIKQMPGLGLGKKLFRSPN